MKCMKCGRDRELGVNLFGHFFCTDCSAETIDSLAATGIAEYIDNSVDVENFMVNDSQRRLNAATVIEPEDSSDEATPEQVAHFFGEEFHDNCEPCEHYDTCKEGTSEAPDFNAPCGGEFIP